jgi:hypothetical protein
MSQVQAKASFASISTFSDVGKNLPGINDAKHFQQIRLKGDGKDAQIYIKEPKGVASARKLSDSAKQYQSCAVEALGGLFVKDLTGALGVSEKRAQTIFGATVVKREQILVGQYRALVQARTMIEVLKNEEGLFPEHGAKLVNDAIRMKVDLKEVTAMQLKAAAAIIKSRPETPLAQALRLVPLVQKAERALGLDRAASLVGELITAGKHVQVTHQHLGDASAYMKSVKDLPADVALKVAMRYQAGLSELAQQSKRPDVVFKLFKALANGPIQDSRGLIRAAHDAMAQCDQLTGRAALDHTAVSGKWFHKLMVTCNLSFAHVEELLAAAKMPSGDFTSEKLDEAATLVAANADVSPTSILLALRHSFYDGLRKSLNGDTKRAIDLVHALSRLGVTEEAMKQDEVMRCVSKVVGKLAQAPALSAEKACASVKFPGIVPPRTHKVAARPLVETKSQSSAPVSAGPKHGLSPLKVSGFQSIPESAPQLTTN